MGLRGGERGKGSIQGGLRGGELAGKGVGFTLPSFTGLALESRIHQTEAKLHAAAATHRELVHEICYEVQRAYFEHETVKFVTEVARAQVTLAEESLRLATQRYGAQLGSFVDLTEVEVALVRSKQKRAQAVYDILIAKATLDYVTGASVGAGEPEVVASKTETRGQMSDTRDLARHLRRPK